MRVRLFNISIEAINSVANTDFGKIEQFNSDFGAITYAPNNMQG